MSDHTKRTRRPGRTRRSVGIRELKAHAAGILRQVRESRASYVVTHRGHAVGVILPVDLDEAVSALLPRDAQRHRSGRFEELLAAGMIRPPIEAGDPAEDWPDIRLARGTAARLIDADRGEA
jgi:prevent-host-death family protein